jgi:hypothetical protein
MLDRNVFDARNERGIVETPTSWEVPHTCHECGWFLSHTPDTINAIFRRLIAAKASMTKGEFGQLETNLGWNLIPDTIMTYPKMRGLCMPTSVVIYDWMHIYFVSGIFNHHLGKMMKCLRACGYTYAALNSYLKLWRWPKQVGALTRKDACDKATRDFAPGERCVQVSSF